MSYETKIMAIIQMAITDKTVDYNTERKVLSVRENRTKWIIILGFLYISNKSDCFYSSFNNADIIYASSVCTEWGC